MKLKEYLKSNGIRITFFAEKVGVSQPALSAWMNGTVSPSILYAYKIEQITKGQVKLKDWVNEEKIIENKNRRKQLKNKKQQTQENIDVQTDAEKSPEKLLS